MQPELYANVIINNLAVLPEIEPENVAKCVMAS
jgi:hypothetical protein